MRLIFTAATLASLALAAAPALADGTTTQGPAVTSNGNTASPAPYQSAKPGTNAQAGQSSKQKNAEAADATRGETQGATIRDQIKGQLEAEGFSHVHIIPDSFLVNAQNKEGQTVVMIINPHSVFSMTESGGSEGSMAAGAAGGAAGTSVQHGTAPSTSTVGNSANGQ